MHIRVDAAAGVVDDGDIGGKAMNGNLVGVVRIGNDGGTS